MEAAVMNAFADAADTLAADSNTGADATYVPEVGASVSLRVVLTLREADPFDVARGPGRLAAGWEAMVPAAQFGAWRPIKGESLIVGDRSFTVETAELDGQSASYTLTLSL
jgi:predicted fused transcriptional regulator/phosphomethylpyrimidine kinase